MTVKPNFSMNLWFIGLHMVVDLRVTPGLPETLEDPAEPDEWQVVRISSGEKDLTILLESDLVQDLYYLIELKLLGNRDTYHNELQEAM